MPESPDWVFLPVNTLCDEQAWLGAIGHLCLARVSASLVLDLNAVAVIDVETLGIDRVNHHGCQFVGKSLAKG